MEAFGALLFAIVFIAWLNPDSVGRWARKAHDAFHHPRDKGLS